MLGMVVAVLCTVGCLVVTLASADWMSWHILLHAGKSNVTKYYTKSLEWGETTQSLVENHLGSCIDKMTSSLRDP